MECFTRSVCRSCRIQLRDLSLSRTFATSTIRQSIPPESPHYVDVPSSFQEDQYRPRRRKGILPVPRELFPAKRPDKPSQQYLDNVTRDPEPHNIVPDAYLTEKGRHRKRMAEVRKEHLREGLLELHKRKQETIAKMEKRSHAKRVERSRLIAQTEREDDRLTSTSVPTEMRVTSKSSTPIANDLEVARAMYEAKRANYERVTAAKHEARLDALHTLYMNARTFITNEAQLNDAIIAEFDKKDFKDDRGPGRSMWSMGPPDTIKDLIAKTQVNDLNLHPATRMLGYGARDGTEERFQRDQSRLKQIAEKLSGGKI